eukprot:CAMPEP_0173158104 /NCGR_PEP_ID=MMETSP1105-20130129/16097_1 /TAXON_ID=2985 /ORGANISM="Ochromonas sp., Strain BG-1" /LENGTH=564 /DNA_ID=CAMNT_0014075847 /DNA_START=208 /DNA_END=1902 /DNA_ORIENTATION=-
MKSANNFAEDIEFTDQLFDELLTELEVDNYTTNNDFITFNNYATDNSSVSSIRTAPVHPSIGKTMQSSSQPNFVMFGSSNHFDISSQASFSSYQPVDYFSNYNNSNNHYSFGVQPPVPIGSNATYNLPTPNITNYDYDYDYNNSNNNNNIPQPQNTLYSLPPQIVNPQQQPLSQGHVQNMNSQQMTFSNNQIYFSGDLNERINEEIFKDEENDLLQHGSPQYTYYSQQPTTVTPSTQHQPITPSTGNKVPQNSVDDDFVIGAVTLSSSPRYPQYTHQTISPNSASMPMNVNLHKSSVKRKNNDISEEDMSPHTKAPSATSSSSNLNLSGSSKPLSANTVMKTNFGLPTTPSPSTNSISNSNSSKEKLHPLHAKFAALLDFPVILFQAFNGGDISKVKEIIQEYTTKDCSLKTPSLTDDVIGQNYVIEFFQAMTDAHPDAVWVAKKCKFQPENITTSPPTSVACRIYFAGTRIFKPQLMNQIMDITFDYHHSDYLFKRPNSSLLDEMDTTQMSIQEKAAMRELETRGKNLSIFGKGSMELLLNHDQKIVSMRFDWVITSFREADL